MLATAVFIHEFTHTQSSSLGRRVDALAKRGFDPDADDDVVQERFAGRPGFTAAYERERDLLLAAHAASSIDAAYAWLVDSEGPALPAEEALTFIRRGGRRWSQDEGLAQFLVFQRLGVDWATEVFGPHERTAIALLSKAVGEDGPT